MSNEDQLPSQTAGLYRVYEDYSRTFRTWLVAYGIGGPILIFTNQRLENGFLASPLARWIVLLFFIGVFMQVLLAFINKTAMWICYASAQAAEECEDEEEFTETKLQELAAWVSRQYWIDFAADLISMASFALATIFIFDIFLPIKVVN